MPKLQSSDKELMDRQFRASESFSREIRAIEMKKISKCLDVCLTTYKNWLKRPEIMTLEKFREFVKFHKIPDDQILRMVRPER